MSERTRSLRDAMLIERLKRAYTFAQPCVVQDQPNAHTVWLRVGKQSFCVTPLSVDDWREAEVFRTSLATALANIVIAAALEGP